MARSSRRRFLKQMALGAGAAALSPLGGVGRGLAGAGDRHPNVILICSDQHRWQSMSFTETPQLQTPSMERMANEGFQFNHCVSNYPVCSPARAMLLTGRWPHETGVVDNSQKSFSALRKDELTLGRVFSQAGYRTHFIGKWHLGGLAKSAVPYGFDESTVWFRTNKHWSSLYYREDGSSVASNRYNATTMTDQALEVISREHAEPYLLTLMWNPPHSDFTDPPAHLMEHYAKKHPLPFRSNLMVTGDRPGESFGARYWGYHAHVAAIDLELKRILDAVDRSPGGRNTVVIYTSDHGGMLASHGLFGKRYPYAEAIRVPFLVRWPGVVPAATSSNHPFGTIDVFPTLCALAGLKPPATARGLDHSAAILGKGDPHRSSQLIMHLRNEHSLNAGIYPTELFRGVETRRHTYAVKETGPWLLFDNEVDPFQRNNLLNEKDHLALRTELHDTLKLWLDRLGDPFLSRQGPSSALRSTQLRSRHL